MLHILVPLDGTGDAESALPFARLLARRADAELVLAHVAEPPVSTESIPAGSMAGGALILPDPAAARELHRARQDYLDDVVARTAALLRPAAPDRRAATDADAPAGDAVAVRGLLLEGPPAGALHRCALDVEADLIVMASHGRRGLARLLLGSVTEDVVRAGGVPVLVVPRGEAPTAPAEEAPLLRHLLVALDGAPEAEAVLDPAMALARLLGSRVTLATVHDVGRADRATLLPTSVLDTAPSGGRAGAPVPAEPSRDEPSERASASGPGDARHLARIAERYADGGGAVATRVLEGHPVVDRLLACTEELGVDWFALTSRGHGLWTRLVEGDVAEALLPRAHVPVLLLRPGGEP